MSVRALGNPLGNPLALPIVKGGGKHEKHKINSHVGDVVLMENPPDDTWMVSSGQIIKASDHKDLYDEFGGVWPQYNASPYSDDTNQYTPTGLFDNFILVGDNAGSQGLNILRVVSITANSINISVIRLDVNPPVAYTATLTDPTIEATNYIKITRPLPDGNVYVGLVGGKQFVIKRNVDGVFSTLKPITIPSSSNGTARLSVHIIDPPSWRVLTSGTNYSVYGTSMLTPSGDSYTATAELQIGTGTFKPSSSNYSFSSANLSISADGRYVYASCSSGYSDSDPRYGRLVDYFLGAYYISPSNTLTPLSIVDEANKSIYGSPVSGWTGTGYGPKPAPLGFSNKIFFNSDSTECYSHSGSTLNVYSKQDNTKFSWIRRFTVTGVVQSLSAQGLLLTISGNDILIYDINTGLLVKTISFIEQFNNILLAHLSPTNSHVVVNGGTLKPSPPLPEKNLICESYPLGIDNIKFFLPNLTPIANSFNNTYSQAVRPRNTYMKVKP